MTDIFKDILTTGSISIPRDYKVSCNACNWTGIYGNCDTEIESNGPEYPTYEVAVCPKCGEGIEI